MRVALTVLALLCGLAAPQARAGDDPVVIELYTSQGCSSCPPADKLLTQLAGRDDVIALALHVDYWDYIGWKDAFGDPAHTRRQQAYARASGHRTVYTPQMIIAGQDHIVGHKPMQVADLIQKHRGAPEQVDLGIVRRGDRLSISARAKGALPAGMAVHLVRFTPHEDVAIGRGENAGKTIRYSNIVRSWTTLGNWDGKGPLSLETDVQGPAAVIIQAPGPGRVLAAARAE